MLPAINPSTLERNPRFKLLYQDLANSRLNADGSSRLIKQQRAQADAEKALQLLRKEDAQKKVLKRGLEDIAETGGDLSENILQACRVAVAVLRGEIGSEDREVLETDMDVFRSSLPKISNPLSERLDNEITLLNEIAATGLESISSSSQSSVTGNQVPAKSLTANISTLLNQISTLTSAIATTRSRIADLTEALAVTNREALESGIRVLEQTVHGSVSRAAKARAENASVVSKGLELKIKILAKTDPTLNDPQLLLALEEYGKHLATTEHSLVGKVSRLEEELTKYEEQGGAMKQIVAKYIELKQKKAHLDSEISRLEDKED